MKLQTAYIGLLAALSGATAQQQFCTDRDDTLIGYAGQREDTIGNSVILDRRGGENCPCSYANIQCSTTIDGKKVNCRDIVINGTQATLGGVENYPSLDVDYSMEICNYNDYDMEFKRAKDSTEPSSYLKFYYPDPQEGQVFLVNEEVDDISKTILNSKTCQSAQSSAQIQTTYSNFYLQAKMQGPLVATDVQNKFCYAYAFEPINLKYDYGDGPCNMHTEISCKDIATGQTCEEKILEMNDSGDIQPFESIIEAKACNNNDRDVYLQYKQCNLKISDGPKDEPNPKDKYKKIRVPYNTTYKVDSDGNAEPMKTNDCQEFSIKKTIDPLLKNFHQINIQGMLYNNLNGNIQFFRDKDCKSFSFESLPVLDPGAPSSVPSVSMSPSVSMVPSGSPSISMEPSSSPSVSLIPSASPSKSMKPSVSPSVSMVPSGSPSLSMQPSSSPSALPSESSKPSTSPSNVPSSGPSSLPSSNPSESSQPSKVPTSGPSSMPSSSPTESIKPSGTPSSIPSSVPSSLPSSNPSLSSKPSEVPSNGPSAIPSTSPSLSMEPSGIPSTSPSVSVAPSLAPSVSVAPSLQPSDSPSMNPSVSSAPSLLPSTAPSCSSSKKSAKSCKSTKTSAPTPSPTKPSGGSVPGGTTDPTNGGGKGKDAGAPSKGDTAGAPTKGSSGTGSTRRLRK